MHRHCTSFLPWGDASGTESAGCLWELLGSCGCCYGLQKQQKPAGRPRAALHSCEVAQTYGWQKWRGLGKQSVSPDGGSSGEQEFSPRPRMAAPASGSPFHGSMPGGTASFAPSHRRCSSWNRQTRGPSCPTCLGFPHRYLQMHLFALLSSGEPVDTTDWQELTLQYKGDEGDAEVLF